MPLIKLPSICQWNKQQLLWHSSIKIYLKLISVHAIYMYIEREKKYYFGFNEHIYGFHRKICRILVSFLFFVLLSLTSVLFRCTHIRTFTQKNQMKSYYINRLLIWPGVLVYRWQTQKQMIVANLFFICDRSKSTLYLHCKQWTERKKKEFGGLLFRDIFDIFEDFDTYSVIRLYGLWCNSK